MNWDDDDDDDDLDDEDIDDDEDLDGGADLDDLIDEDHHLGIGEIAIGHEIADEILGGDEDEPARGRAAPGYGFAPGGALPFRPAGGPDLPSGVGTGSGGCGCGGCGCALVLLALVGLLSALFQGC